MHPQNLIKLWENPEVSAQEQHQLHALPVISAVSSWGMPMML